MNELEINKREVYRHRIPVTQKGTIIRWQFQTKKKSIKFGLEYENVLNNTYFQLLPCERYEADKSPVTGSHVAEAPGIYVLVFDNSFSKNTPKQLVFVVDLEKVNEQEYQELSGKYEGWLYLTKHRSWKGWRRRWFILHDGLLEFSRQPGSPIQGSVDLRSAMISVAPHQRLLNIDSGEIVLHLRAMTEGTFNEWVQRIKNCKVFLQEAIVHGLRSSMAETSAHHLHHQMSHGHIPMIVSDDFPYSPSSTLRDVQSMLKSLLSSPTSASSTPSSSPKQDNNTSRSPSAHSSPVLIDSLIRLRDLLAMAQLFQAHLQQPGLTAIPSRPASPAVPSSSLSQAPPAAAAAAAGVSSPMSLSMAAKRVASAYFHKKDTSSPQNSALSSQRGSISNLSSTSLANSLHQPPTPLNAQEEKSLSSLFSCLAEAHKLVESLIPTAIQQRDIQDATVQRAIQIVLSLEEKQLKDTRITDTRTPFTRFTSNSSIKDEFHDAMEALNVADNLLTEYSAESDLDLENSTDALIVSSHMDDTGNFDDAHEGDENASLSSSSEEEIFKMHARRHTSPSVTSLTGEPVKTHRRGPSYYPITATVADELASTSATEAKKEDAVTSTSAVSIATGTTAVVAASLSVSVPAPSFRKTLPAFAKESNISVLSLLRKNVGKDLARITMPVHFNEPLSALQRMSEKFEYCYLLQKATQMADSLDRLVYVATFAVASNASLFGRIWKPFNPLLGETFECVRPDLGFRFIAEKVSHHPLITACHAEGNHFSVWQTGQMKSKFWGKSIELTPQGYVHCELSNYKDHFVWNEITSCMHNVISGKKWIELYGEMTVKNLTTGEMCRLNFKESSFFSDAKNEIVGTVYNAQNEKVRYLRGRWNDAFYEEMDENQLYCLWRMHPTLPNNDKYYGFSEFAMSLNQMLPSMDGAIPKTDSRYRGDIRLVEDGKLDDADKLKGQLEQKQRELRQQYEGSGETPTKKDKGATPWQPLWFKPQVVKVDPLTGKSKDEIIEYVYTNKYWEAREKTTYPTSYFPNFTDLQ